MDILQGLPRAVRELSIAAVGAAHARDSLDHHTLEAEALSRDTADASARMPEVQAAALEGQANLATRAPALLEVCTTPAYSHTALCAAVFLVDLLRACCSKASRVESDASLCNRQKQPVAVAFAGGQGSAAQCASLGA